MTLPVSCPFCQRKLKKALHTNSLQEIKILLGQAGIALQKAEFRVNITQGESPNARKTLLKVQFPFYTTT